MRIIVLNNSKNVNEYRAQFLQYGLASYEDCDEGVALLEKEVIDKMLPSFIGKPVVIDHVDAQPEEIFNSGLAVGRVTDASWNPETGWYECTFTAESQEAKNLIKNGYSVSCAFNVKSVKEGGEWHAIKFQEAITDGSFTHLALVANPRYEDSKIFTNGKVLINSKGANMVQNAKYTVKIVDRGGAFMAKVFRGDDEDAKAGLASRLKGTTDVFPTEQEAKDAAKELMNEKENSIYGVGTQVEEVGGKFRVKWTEGRGQPKYKDFDEKAEAQGLHAELMKRLGREDSKENSAENDIGKTTRDGKTIDEVSVEVTGKKYRQLPDDSPAQEAVMTEFEKRGGVAQKAFNEKENANEPYCDACDRVKDKCICGKENSSEGTDKKNNGILRVSKKNCSDTNAGISKMFGWFKKKQNSVDDEAKKKAQADAALKAQEAAKEMKENGEQVNLAEQMVDVGGEQVSLADLIKTYQAEQAEKAIMAQNEVVEETMSPEEEIADESGNVYKLGDLVNSYTARKNAEADAAAKAEADKKAADAAAKGKENETDEEKELRIKKENEKAEAEKAEKEKADAEAKAKENSKGAKKDIKFFKKLNSLKDSATEIRENGIETLKDKIARGKQKYGSKKKK